MMTADGRCWTYCATYLDMEGRQICGERTAGQFLWNNGRSCGPSTLLSQPLVSMNIASAAAGWGGPSGCGYMVDQYSGGTHLPAEERPKGRDHLCVRIGKEMLTVDFKEGRPGGWEAFVECLTHWVTVHAAIGKDRQRQGPNQQQQEEHCLPSVQHPPPGVLHPPQRAQQGRITRGARRIKCQGPTKRGKACGVKFPFLCPNMKCRHHGGA